MDKSKTDEKKADEGNFDEHEPIYFEKPKKTHLNPKYYEGILQLRGPNEQIIKFIVDFLKANEKVFVSKEIPVKNGVDIYISSNKFLQSLGKRLKQTFGGEMELTRRIHTRNRLTSKDVYRLTVLYIAPKVAKGNVISIEKKIILISTVEEMIHGIDLVTGNKVSTKYKKKEMEILEKQKTKISKIYPQVEVLDPENFQSVRIMNPKRYKSQALGENVSIVIHKGIYLVD